MKQFIFLICTIICIPKLYSQTDSLCKANQNQISRMEQSLKSIKSENAILKQSVHMQEKKIYEQNSLLDSLISDIASNNLNVKKNTEQLGARIDKADLFLQTKASNNDLKLRTLWGVSLFILFVMISLVIYWLLHKRITKGYLDVVALKQKANKLNEDILNQFSLDMIEMQKITASLVALSSSQVSQTNNVNSDHSLIKILADRITFMEMTLYKMDKGVRGYKQLSKSIAQMKNNLQANGYELVDMMGKLYHEGMKVTANFIEDEDLKEGEQVITGIIKPQINYQGVMIQSAQIVVSQNI